MIKKVVIHFIYLLFLFSLSQSQSAPIIWQTSSEFKSGQFNYQTSPTSPASQSFTISYATSFSALSSRHPILGITDFDFNIADGNFTFEIKVKVYYASNFIFDVICNQKSKIIALSLQFLAVGNSFTPPMSMTRFQPTYTRALNQPIEQQHFVNFFASTGVTLNLAHENVLLPFIHIMSWQSTQACVDINFDFFIANSTHYSVIFRSNRCNGTNLFGYGFSRIIFDKTQIQAIGGSYFDYGIIEQLSISNNFDITIFPPLFTQNFIYGIHSFAISNQNQISFTSSINSTIGNITIMPKSLFTHMKFSYLHHKSRTCPTTHPYYNISQQLCYDACNNRYFGNNLTFTCDSCLYDCWQCSNSSQCTNCSEQNDHRKLITDENGVQRCGAISGYFSNGIDQIAIKCSSQCFQCQNSMGCTSCASQTMLLVGNECNQCSSLIPNCQTCVNTTFCSKCKSNYQLTELFQCQQIQCVDIYCSNCSNNQFYCKQCITHFFSSNGKCVPICGDGAVLASQQCDDNNTNDYDGCSSVCEIQDQFNCTLCDLNTNGCQNQSQCFYVGQLQMNLVWLYKIENVNGIKIRFNLKKNLQIWKQINFTSILKLSVFTENKSRLLTTSQPIPIDYQSVFYEPFTNSMQLQIYYNRYNLQGRQLQVQFNLTNTNKMFTSSSFVKLMQYTVLVQPYNNQAANWYSFEHYSMQQSCRLLVYAITSFLCIMMCLALGFCVGKLVVLQSLLTVQSVFYCLLSLSYMSTEWAALVNLRYISGQIWFDDVEMYLTDSGSPVTTKGIFLYSSLLQNMIISLGCLLLLITIGVIIYLIKFCMTYLDEKQVKMKQNISQISIMQLNLEQKMKYPMNEIQNIPNNQEYLQTNNNNNNVNTIITVKKQQNNNNNEKNKIQNQSQKFNQKNQNHNPVTINQNQNKIQKIENNNSSNNKINTFFKSVFYKFKSNITQTNGLNILGQYTFAWLVYCLCGFTICFTMQILYLTVYNHLDIVLMVLVFVGVIGFSFLLLGRDTKWKKLFFGEFIQEMVSICCVHCKYYHLILLWRILSGLIIMLAIYDSKQSIISPMFMIFAVIDSCVLILRHPYIYGYSLIINNDNQYQLVKIKLNQKNRLSIEPQNQFEQVEQEADQKNINMNILGFINYIFSICIYILILTSKNNDNQLQQNVFDNNSIQWTPLYIAILLLLIVTLNALYLCLQIYHQCRHQGCLSSQKSKLNSQNNNILKEETMKEQTIKEEKIIQTKRLQTTQNMLNNEDKNMIIQRKPQKRRKRKQIKFYHQQQQVLDQIDLQ